MRKLRIVQYDADLSEALLKDYSERWVEEHNMTEDDIVFFTEWPFLLQNDTIELNKEHIPENDLYSAIYSLEDMLRIIRDKYSELKIKGVVKL